MSKTNLRLTLKKLAAPMFVAVALIAPAAAQETKPNQTPATPSTTQTTTATQTPTAEQTAATKSAETQPASAATPSAEPLFKEYKGVSLGLAAEEVRAKLGKPAEKSDEMDFFIFSERERARVYYDKEKKAHAVIVTYIGANASAPQPSAIIGTDIEAKADGSMYKMVTYPQAGYWLAYSRTAGDSPMVMITMQKTP
ncbi:MAG TPA: hypothetical protein VFX96_12285 [Pyrinomonadaceae bacterium]|nr:hypothetical protein [Pyrinomonadaceae bacterium]